MITLLLLLRLLPLVVVVMVVVVSMMVLSKIFNDCLLIKLNLDQFQHVS
jgi:hypothetical protein